MDFAFFCTYTKEKRESDNLMKFTKIELSAEIMKIQRLMENTEKEIYVCRKKQNQLLMLDLLQKKHHYEQEITAMQQT